MAIHLKRTELRERVKEFKEQRKRECVRGEESL